MENEELVRAIADDSGGALAAASHTQLALPFDVPAGGEVGEAEVRIPVDGLVDTKTDPQLALASIDAGYESDDVWDRDGWMRTGPKRRRVEGSSADDVAAVPSLTARFEADDDHEMVLSLPAAEENLSPYKWLLPDREAVQLPSVPSTASAAAASSELAGVSEAPSA